MTTEHPTSTPGTPVAASGALQQSPCAAGLLAVVEAVRGVRGLEPGLSMTLRAIDARLRLRDDQRARYGLVVEPDGQVVVEVALDETRPVRLVVADVQRALRRALGDPERLVTVRVQSLTAQTSGA